MRSMLITAAALAGLTAGMASAQSSSVSVGYTLLDGDGAEVGAIALRAGHDFTPHFGVEGEGLIGIQDDTIDVLGTPVDVSLDYGLAAYGVARLPVGQNGSNLFVRAGYGTVRVEGSSGGISVSEDVDGFAYGVGAEFLFFQNQGLRLDLTRFDGDDGELDSYGASWVIRF